MNLSIPGIYENGEVKLSSVPPQGKWQKVIVTFLDPDQKVKSKKTKGILGQLEGQNFSIPENFNEPLEDFKDYI